MAEQMKPYDKVRRVTSDEMLCGKRFGLLTVHGRDRTKKNDCYWMCVCDCGSLCSFRVQDLCFGQIGFCGNNSRHIRRYK